MKRYRHIKYNPFFLIALILGLILTIHANRTNKPISHPNPNSHYTVAGVAK